MFGPHFNIVFLGGGGSILSEPGFRGKYSKIKHITCIFLNIFVQDCSSPLNFSLTTIGISREGVTEGSAFSLTLRWTVPGWAPRSFQKTSG